MREADRTAKFGSERRVSRKLYATAFLASVVMAQGRSTQEAVCPLQGLLARVTKKWCLLVLNQIGMRGSVGYNQILRELEPISPKSLADTLRELQELGLIERRVIDRSPPRVEYTLTPKGRGLKEAVLPLLEWAAKTTNHADCPILGHSPTKKPRPQPHG